MKILLDEKILNVYSVKEIEDNDVFGFIYLTINTINDKKYIGQRIKKGKWENYYGSGKLLKKDIKEYSTKNFNRFIIDVYFDQQEGNKLEYFYTKMFNVVERDDFYNQVYGGKSLPGELNPQYGKKGKDSPNYGRKYSEETRKKFSESKKGDKNPNYHKKYTDEEITRIVESRKKVVIPNKVLKYSIDGDFICEYLNAEEASKDNKITVRNIYKACENNNKLAGGFMWRYKKNNYETKIPPYNPRTPDRSNFKSKKIDQFSISGDYLATYKSAWEIKKELGYDDACIWRCCNGITKTSYGYIWRYAKDSPQRGFSSIP